MSVSLIGLKNEILNSQDEIRLLELEVNLKHFINIHNHKIDDDSENYPESELKDIRNSVSIAQSYLKIIDWRLKERKADKQSERLDRFSLEKKELFQIFDDGLKLFTDKEVLNPLLLKEENKDLKKIIKELKSESDIQKLRYELILIKNKLPQKKEINDLYNRLRALENLCLEIKNSLENKNELL